MAYLKSNEFSNFGVKYTGVDAGCAVGLFAGCVRFDPAALDGPRLEEVDALFHDIEFHETAVTVFWVINVIEFLLVETVDVPNVAQPIFQGWHMIL
eukprot:scaffold100781_cov54-Attheya_sp.AAC.2